MLSKVRGNRTVITWCHLHEDSKMVNYLRSSKWKSRCQGPGKRKLECISQRVQSFKLYKINKTYEYNMWHGICVVYLEVC